MSKFFASGHNVRGMALDSFMGLGFSRQIKMFPDVWVDDFVPSEIETVKVDTSWVEAIADYDLAIKERRKAIQRRKKNRMERAKRKEIRLQKTAVPVPVPIAKPQITCDPWSINHPELIDRTAPQQYGESMVDYIIRTRNL